MPTKHALIVGVDKYCNIDKKYELSGCVNDAKLIKGILENYFAFEDSHITELHDEQATRDGILGAMNQLVDRIDTDDIVVFHFSGHGSRRTSPDPGEGSGKDSTIMTYDSGRGPEPNLDIVNLELNDWIKRLAAKSKNISMTFDCCHSGTVTRDAFAATVRAAPDDTRSIEDMGIDVDALPEVDKTATRGAKSDGDWLGLGESYVVMSGCRNDEYSHEFTQEDGDEVIRNGALTYYLTNALTKAKPGSTYRDVFELAHQGVNTKFPTQNPQMEGAVDREIFGTRDIDPLHFVPVVSVDGDEITLDGGAAHGIISGSRWSVYPQGTKQTKGSEVLGEIEITSVGPLSSMGKLKGAGAQISSGARCVEKARSPDEFILKVDLSDVPDTHRAELEAAIEKSALLAAAKSASSADSKVYVLTARKKAAEGDPVPQIDEINEPTWAIVNREGALTMPLHATAEKDVIDLLAKNLETTARYQNAIRLDNPDSILDVQFNIYAQNNDGDWESANGGHHVFTAGDRIGFEVVNKEKEPVFVSVLDFGLSGKIKLLYPPKTTSEVIEPGKTLKIAMGDRKLRLGLPDNFSADQGTGAFKAFITNAEADFQWLQQEGTRSAGGKSGLRGQFEAAYNGPKMRDAGFDDEEDDDAEDWTASCRTFEIRRE